MHMLSYVYIYTCISMFMYMYMYTCMYMSYPRQIKHKASVGSQPALGSGWLGG